MRTRVMRFLAVCLMLTASVPAAGQSSGGALSGTVRDGSGAVLVGVTVTARHLGSGAVASAVVDERGEYRLTGLVAGEYAIEGALPGFRSDAVRITVTAGRTARLDLTLSLAPIAETVTVTRADQELAVVPKAIDVVSSPGIQEGQRKVSLAEGLQGIPGLFVQNRGNYSESFGVRLSLRAPVRGVGIGVRGVQMVQDGIPLTVADGTTQPTNVDLGSTGRIEVIRGPSSLLYGNAAGGVVSLWSEVPSARAFFAQPDVQSGSYGYQRQQMKVGGTRGRFGYLVNASRLETDGFRAHSHTEARQTNLVVRATLSPHTEVRGVFNLFDMPFAESPSTATFDEAMTTPRSVRRLAIDQGFGEASTQGQGGLTVEHRFAGGYAVRATGWGMWRNVWNPIPNRIVDLGRTGGGFRSEMTGATGWPGVPVTWTTGIDASMQRDDSREFENAGVSGGGRTREGAVLVDQLERVRSIAPFMQVSVAPRPRWMLTAGVRYDDYRFDADDRLLTNGDQSGGRTLDAFSPAAGVTFAATPNLNVFASVSTAYETPTTQELSNRPTGEGGFNPDLEPEQLRTYEGGVRGLVARWHLRYDVTGYVSALTNALVQYQRADEQDFFRNAGESSRRGLELQVDWRPVARLQARVSYTYQRFRFVRFVTDAGDYSGNREPGAPPQQVFASLTYDTPWGARATMVSRWIDAYAVNSANTYWNWAASVTDLRVVWTRGTLWLGARPYVGIDNVFNERYNGSVVPNAFGNRYYEPSPGREFYGGLTVGFGTR